jgi:hypothetical protein
LEFLTAALLKVRVFWDVMPCHWMSSFRRFEWSRYLHLQGQAAAVLLGLPDQKMKTRRATTHPQTRRHTPKKWIMTPAVLSLRTKHKISHLSGQGFFKAPNSSPSSSMNALYNVFLVYFSPVLFN